MCSRGRLWKTYWRDERLRYSRLFTLTFRRPPIYNLLSYESVARAGGRICARIKGRAAGRTDERLAGRLRVLVKFWLAPTLRAQAVKVAQMPTLRVHGRHALHGDESSQPTLVRREAETKRDERTSEPSATVGLFATFFATAPHTRACGQKCF